MSKYKVLWTDMHSNIHHNQIDDLDKWIKQMEDCMNFWPIAYYPYGMIDYNDKFQVEGILNEKDILSDWEKVRHACIQANQKGFPMFMGYEWQGSGEDGDHNVFFLDNDQDMKFDLRYEDLVRSYEGVKAIGIPHHLAYQVLYRGKNWDTHNETFSPFVETYSSHGSSENDTNPIPMDRHVHMGPRTGETCVERGWEKGYKFGVIASGDNHSCPGVYGFGYCAVLARSNKKEDIWDAFINRRTYGVSKDRMLLDFTIDEHDMGETIPANEYSKLSFHIVGGDAIDRVEIIKDNQVVQMIPHIMPYKEEINGTVKFKFKVEFGWGPDRKIFPDIDSKSWTGHLKTNGKIISIEKVWSNFGQELKNVTEQECDFSLTSYKSTATGKWMGPSAVTTEGFIFEIEDDIDSEIELTVNGKVYHLLIKDILYTSKIYPLLDETKKLLKDRFNYIGYYREDATWHNSYKFKVSQGVLEKAYTIDKTLEIDTTDASHVRLKAYQKNGGTLWSSPIFIKKDD